MRCFCQSPSSVLQVWLLPSQEGTKHRRIVLPALLLTQGWCRQWVLFGGAVPPGNSQQLPCSSFCIKGSQSKFAFYKRQSGHQSRVHAAVPSRWLPFALPGADLDYTSRSCCLCREKKGKNASKRYLVRGQFPINKANRSKFQILRVRTAFIKWWWFIELYLVIPVPQCSVPFCSPIEFEFTYIKPSS